MFKIGEKVVCISNFITPLSENEIKNGVKYPIKDNIYTIRGIIERFNGDIGLFLEEIVNPKLNYNGIITECNFWSDRFRKLDYDFVEEVIRKVTEKPIIIE